MIASDDLQQPHRYVVLCAVATTTTVVHSTTKRPNTSIKHHPETCALLCNHTTQSSHKHISHEILHHHRANHPRSSLDLRDNRRSDDEGRCQKAGDDEVFRPALVHDQEGQVLRGEVVAYLWWSAKNSDLTFKLFIYLFIQLIE